MTGKKDPGEIHWSDDQKYEMYKRRLSGVHTQKIALQLGVAELLVVEHLRRVKPPQMVDWLLRYVAVEVVSSPPQVPLLTLDVEGAPAGVLLAAADHEGTAKTRKAAEGYRAAVERLRRHLVAQQQTQLEQKAKQDRLDRLKAQLRAHQDAAAQIQVQLKELGR